MVRILVVERRRDELERQLALRGIANELAFVPQTLDHGHRVHAERQVGRDRPRERVDRRFVEAAIGAEGLLRIPRGVLEPAAVLEFRQDREAPFEKLLASEGVEQRLRARGHVAAVRGIVVRRTDVHVERPSVVVRRELLRHVAELQVGFQAHVHDAPATVHQTGEVVVIQHRTVGRVAEAVPLRVAAGGAHDLDVFGEFQNVVLAVALRRVESVSVELPDHERLLRIGQRTSRAGGVDGEFRAGGKNRRCQRGGSEKGMNLHGGKYTPSYDALQ